MRKLTTSGLLVFTTLSWCADYRIEANIRYDHYPETVLDVLQPVAPALKNRPGTTKNRAQAHARSDAEEPIHRLGQTLGGGGLRTASDAHTKVAPSSC